MTSTVSLWMTEPQAEVLRKHLFPDDGKEAAAVALCGRVVNDAHAKLSIHHIECIPYEECLVRKPDRLVWPTDRVIPLLGRAEREGLSLVKFHSHPGGTGEFSRADDQADSDLFDCVTAWLPGVPHASVVMLPDRCMFGRAFIDQASAMKLRIIGVVGDRIHVYPLFASRSLGAGQEATQQVFGERTSRLLAALRIAVVGASGTGSLIIEQLIRSGVGELIAVDDDVVLERNLNRIVNATADDAKARRTKVEVAARTAVMVGMGTKITPLPMSLLDPDAVRQVAVADMLFGCVDTTLARTIMNRIATFHTQPYFDLGVRIDADEMGGIEYVGGVVHYLQPGLSTLQSRGAIDGERLRAEWLALTDPASLERLRGEGYLRGFVNQRPVVMPLNMHIAGLAVLEFLARLHGFRIVADSEFAVHGTALSHGLMFNQSEPEGIGPFASDVGRGQCTPLLGLPVFEAWLGNDSRKPLVNYRVAQL